MFGLWIVFCFLFFLFSPHQKISTCKTVKCWNNKSNFTKCFNSLKNVLFRGWGVYVYIYICAGFFFFFFTLLFWLTKCLSSLNLLQENCVWMFAMQWLPEFISWEEINLLVGQKKSVCFVFAMSSQEVDPEYWLQGTNLKFIEINRKTDHSDNDTCY